MEPRRFEKCERKLSCNLLNCDKIKNHLLNQQLPVTHTVKMEEPALHQTYVNVQLNLKEIYVNTQLIVALQKN